MSLVSYMCHACEAPIASVFYVDANAREICRACFDASRPPLSCEHCGGVCAADDRLPTRAGGVCHAACNLKITNAYGWALSSALLKRRMGIVRGGRS